MNEPCISTLRGVEVSRVGVSIFIPLPIELWTGGGGCDCGECDGNGYWDTLAVATTPQGLGRDTTWTVHNPRLHKGSYARLKGERSK